MKLPTAEIVCLGNELLIGVTVNTNATYLGEHLTRLGFDSKTVITGDVTQSDLPKDKVNGLIDAERVLSGIEGIEFIHLTGKDVVRHELVQRIIKAYGNEPLRFSVSMA